MKTIRNILILCAVLCFATACQKEADMTIKQKTMLENADIRQIDVSDAWEVTVVADNRTYVELEYSAYLEPNLNVQMEGTELKIGFIGNVYPTINSVFRATVHTSQLEELDVDDAAQVQCIGDFTGSHIKIELSEAAYCNGLVFSGQSCEINMEGTSLLTGFQFVGSYCKSELEQASQFNGRIEATERLEIDLEDASRFVNKGGETAIARIKLHNNSQLNIVETKVNEMHVELSEASEATVWVTSVLEGTMTQASTLYYKGNPQINVECSDDSQLIPF